MEEGGESYSLCHGVSGEKERESRAVVIRGIQKSTSDECLQRCKENVSFVVCLKRTRRRDEGGRGEGKRFCRWPKIDRKVGSPSNRGINLWSLALKSSIPRSDKVIHCWSSYSGGRSGQTVECQVPSDEEKSSQVGFEPGGQSQRRSDHSSESS